MLGHGNLDEPKYNVDYIGMSSRDDSHPTTVLPMWLLSTMVTTALITIMLSLNFFFRSLKCLFYSITSKNISVKMLTKHLGSFIANHIFRINHNHKLNSNIKKSLSYFLRMARVNKYKIWKII